MSDKRAIKTKKSCASGASAYRTRVRAWGKASVLLLATTAFSVSAIHGKAAIEGDTDSEREAETITVTGVKTDLPTSTGSRLGLSIRETPASVEIMSGEVIRKRLDTSVLETVTRSAGFTNEGNPGNGGQSIAARGFRGQGSVTKLFDGTNYYTAASTLTFPFDTWGIERIEILKGPSSVMYGEGGIGGAINVIPKSPQQEPAGNIRMTVGEDDTTFVGIDLTGGLTDTLAYRLNYSNSQSDNWVKNGDSDADMLSLALRWELNEAFTLSLRYDYGDQKPMRYFGIPVVNGRITGDFKDENFNVGDARIRYEDEALRLKAEWRLSDTVSLQSEVYRLETERFWKNAEFYSFDGGTGLVDRFDPLVIGHDMEHDGFRTHFIFSNTLAGMPLLSALGFEINDVDFSRPSNFGPANPNPIDWSNDFDTVDPDHFDPGTLSDLTDAAVLLDNVGDVDQFALFGESRIKLSDQLSLVTGLRYENVETDYTRFGRAPIHQTVDKLTGRLGWVYDVTDITTLYAQYTTGATHPSDSIVTASPSNREAGFIESEQTEVGIKQEALDGRLQWTLALFDIVRNDLIEDDPDSGNPGDQILIPEQTSKGIELGVDFQVNQHLQLYANGVILESDTDAGVAALYIPEKTANLGAQWTASEQLQFMADVRYVGERFHPGIPIPSYTVVDASTHLQFTDRLSLALRVDNLFDERYAVSQYYSSTWLVGKPRSLSLTADYSF